MNGRPDPELEDLFKREPGLERQVNLLRAARLKAPPLDPNFRPALRRRLMHDAYERFEMHRRPSLLARIFSGPGMAVGLAAAAVLLIAVVLVSNGGNWFGPGQVSVTSVGAVTVNQPITVSFSQAMDHTSVEKAIQIEPATQVTYSWHGNDLVIQPASGELAPNTQYHVTVAADAKTAPGVKIGQAAVVAVTTAPLPSPSPTPSPSPSPPAPPQITGEHTLPGTGGTVIGWSPDGKVVLFIDGEDLKTVNADGTGLQTIQAGVKLASVAPSGTSLAYLTTGSAPKLYQAALDGSGAQVLDARDVSAIGWQGGKPLILSNTDVGPAGGASIAKLPNAAACQFSPDGSKLICATAGQPNAAPPVAATSFLFDIAGQKSTPWTTPGQHFSWSPDSTRLAYWLDGATYIGAPDGTAAIQVAKSATPGSLSWSPDGKLLLLADPTGASIVKSDGSSLHQLSQGSFKDPVWGPGGNQFAFARAGVVWIDDLSVSGSSIDLGAAASVIDQYEQARIKGDVATASALLTASAVPTIPSPLAADVHLTRYFVISSQTSATEVRCTVRLIFAKTGGDEVRYQDEQLVLVPVGTGLKISSIADSAPHDLGKGPTVNSVQLQSGSVVVVFDSDLDPKTVNGSARLTGADGEAVAVTVSYANRKLSVNAKLKAGEKYHLSLGRSIQDIAGQPLQGGYEYDFVAVGPKP
ncbi:MAG TPA: Ig-like domain-containing protein [Candidatus Dormibacteraeota bacterium]